MFDILPYTIALGLVVLVAYNVVKTRRDIVRFRKAAKSTFKSLRYTDSKSGAFLDGRVAHVLKENEEITHNPRTGTIRTYALVRIAANQDGRRFWCYIPIDSEPVIKEMSGSQNKVF